MNDDIIVFSSEKEKMEYADYLKRKFNHTKTRPLDATKDFLRKRTNKIKKDGLIFPELLLYGLLTIIGLSLTLTGTEAPFLALLACRIASLECIWNINRGVYRAIIPSAIMSPFIFGFYSVERGIEEIKHIKDIKKFNKTAVVKEMDNDEKNSKERIVNSIIKEVNKNKTNEDSDILTNVVTKMELLRDKILSVRNNKSRESYVYSMYLISHFLLRANKLNEKRKEEAFNYVLDQLDTIGYNVENELYLERNNKVEEQTKEEPSHTLSYKSV